MEFDFNFHKCPICENKMNYDKGNLIGNCPNGCCKYDIDPQGENVIANLFDSDEDEAFHVPLYKKTHHEPEVAESLKEELNDFLQQISYWKEDSRYLFRETKSEI